MARSAMDPPQTPQREASSPGTSELKSAKRSAKRPGHDSRRVSLARVASSTIERASTPNRRPETPVRQSTGHDLANKATGTQPPSQYDIEQWMKLLRSNRINAENSWSFPLIDYFQDIIKDDNGINFQKASYTLDGCVKVYTTRVDSLVAKTTRLLSGLVGSETADDGDADMTADLDEGDMEGDEGGPKRKNKKAKSRKTATCVANPRTLDVDLEKLRQMAGSVRNRQDFDEGGTSGTRLWKETTDPLGWIGGRHGVADAEPRPEINGARVDVAFYRTAFLHDMESRNVHPSAEAIDVAVQDPQTSTAALVEGVQGWTLDEGPEAEVDGFDGDANPDLLDENDLDYDHLTDAFSVAGTDFDAGGDSMEPGSGIKWDVMQYFDERSSAGWAGPSHWRVDHYHNLKGTLPGSSVSITPAKPIEGTAAGQHRKKQPVIIDFYAEAPDVEALFTEGTHINLPKTTNLQSKHLLPEDYHVTSKQMTRVFLRPDDGPAPAILHANRKHRDRGQPVDSEEQDMDLNDQFWGQVNSEAPMMYDADFYQEDVPDFEPDEMPPSSTNYDGIAALSQSRRNDQITYARVARNVDVQQLKTNMWDAMQTTTEAHSEEPLSLSTVMHDTAQKYPAEKQQELSTPFYFICLLHLANEQGLTLSSTPDLGDLKIET